jgi:ATP-binding cassette subfamily B protein
MLVLGMLGVLTAVAVPLSLRRVIDGPLAEGRSEGVPLLVGLVATLGVVEAAMGFWRRWLQSTTAVAMERSMRDVLYATVQTLPPSFHDRWHTGQLLSRMTGDLSTIRRFSGFGLVIGLVNVVTITVVSGLLIWLDPVLGVVVACSLVPVTVASRRFGRRFGAVSRQVQDGQGDHVDRGGGHRGAGGQSVRTA